MVISDNDITSIIADVEREVLGLAQQTLAKGEGSKSSDGGSAAGAPPLDGGSASSASDGGSASPAAAGDESVPPASPVASAAASPDPASAAPAVPGADPSASAAPGIPGAPGAAAPGAPGADPAAQGLGDHEALVAEFAQMPLEQVAQILEAAKQVLLSAQPPGGAPSPSPTDPSASPQGLADPSAGQGAPAPQGLAQSEVGDGGLDAGVPAGAKHNGPSNPTTTHLEQVASNGGSLTGSHATASAGGKVLSPPKDNSGNGTASTLATTSQTPEGTLKSEVNAELETLRKANKELEARFERLTGVVTELVEKPIRKAITGMDYVSIRGGAPAQAAKASESLNRAEITRRLNEKVQDPSLTKHDRELITDAYETRNFSKIEHLLK